MRDAQAIMYFYPGMETLSLEPVKDDQVKVKLKIAADCRLGEHAMRVRTATGLSELRTFYVGNLPMLEEKEPNSSFDTPQPVALNHTINGIIQNEDVDYFVVECKKGQRLSVEVEGMRLGRTVFDPYLAILNTKRFELVTADDTTLVWQDSVASLLVPEDGQYIIMLRETSYGGSGACDYRMHIGNFPRPTAVYPAGGKLGDQVEVNFLGDVKGTINQKIQLPSQPDSLFGLLPQDADGVAPSPHSFRLSNVGNVLEVEPNNDQKTATSAELPLAFNGIISEPGDVDSFRFAAKKGQVFEVNCYARLLRSSLDPVMTVSRMGAGAVASNDDNGRNPDSYFRFTAPEDREYVLTVTDHLGRGGPDFVYRVEFTPVEASLAMNFPEVARYSQIRQTVVIPKGNRYAAMVNIRRTNFGGDLVLNAEGLPPGVTLHADQVPAGLSQFPVVFEAAADAPVSGKLANLTAHHVEKEKNIFGGMEQSIPLIFGNPGQSIYWTHTVNKMATAVAEEAPFKIDLVPPKAPLVHNGALQLKVVAQRKEGFKGPIKVMMLFNPPGVSSVPAITIAPDQTEGFYPLNANANAEMRTWKIVLLGESDVNGPMWASTALTDLVVGESLLKAEVGRAAVEQGQPTTVTCKLEQLTPFEGKATLKLLGLPAKVTTQDLEITKDSTEVTFQVTTDVASPNGNHKNIVCQLVLDMNGESVVQTAGVTELRIDKPLPPKPDAKPAPKPVAQATPAPTPKPVAAKPLSRLEQLRQQAEAAKAAGAQ